MRQILSEYPDSLVWVGDVVGNIGKKIVNLDTPFFASEVNDSPQSHPLPQLGVDACLLRIVQLVLLSLPTSFTFKFSLPSRTPEPIETHSSLSLHIGPSLLATMKHIHQSASFSITSQEWSRFSAILNLLDPDFCEQVSIKRRCASACSQLSSGAKEGEAALTTLTRLLPLLRDVAMFLKSDDVPKQTLEYHQLISKEVESTQPTHPLDSVARTLCGSIIVLYTVSLMDKSVPVKLARELFDIIENILSLRQDWSINILCSISLFLQLHMPIEQDKDMDKVQQALMQSFTSIQFDSASRDLLLSSISRPQIIYLSLMNIILNCKSYDTLREGEAHQGDQHGVELIAFQVFGVMLGVCQEDLETLRSTQIGAQACQFDDWYHLLAPLKVLTWRMCGMSSPQNDSQECCQQFTHTLEVNSSHVMFLSLISYAHRNAAPLTAIAMHILPISST